MQGIGVMIGKLFGDGGGDLFQSAIGKTIASLSLSDEALHIALDDGQKIKLRDRGQSCCESRYMHTDDDLERFVGARLLSAEIKDAPDQVGDYGDTHEIQFLDVTTDRGVFQMASHNEHNGYYGGFDIVCEEGS